MWDQERSEKRIREHLEKLPAIEIKKLEKLADLESLLSECVCREITGAHVYIDLDHFSRLVAGDEKAEMRRVVRAVHIYQRQIAWIVETVFDGVRVHFQGARVHVLFYRPIADSEVIATKAFLVMAVVRDFVRHVFNPSFPTLEHLIVTGGADFGSVIGTQNGTRGGRELLFFGAPANRAAKIIGSGLRITTELHDVLPTILKEQCTPEEDGQYRIAALDKEMLAGFLQTYGFSWDREEARDRITADLDQFSLAEIALSEATELIDFETLSIYRNKEVLAASIFADLTGFTKFIDEAEDESREEAITALHLARKEFTRVVRRDFDGVRVQFQGDRLQALVHLPNDEDKIARKATNVALGLQSSMNVLRDLFPPMASLHLAVGVALGRVIVTRLGQRGHRDRIVLGTSVIEAAANEERTSKRQIGISAAVYKALDEEVQEHFSYSETAKCYVATGLTWATLKRRNAAVPYAGSAPVIITSTDRGLRVIREEVPSGQGVIPATSFAE